MPVKHRKNFLPAVLFTLLSWALVAFIIFFVDPVMLRDFLVPGSYLPFFLCLFLAVFLSGSFLFINVRRGFLFSIGVVVYLYLRLVGLGHMLNAILLFGFLIFLELAFSNQRLTS